MIFYVFFLFFLDSYIQYAQEVVVCSKIAI